VTEGIHDRFVARWPSELKALGRRRAEAGTEIGPVVDQSQLEQDLEYIEIGKREGAKLAAGGERLKRATPGFYLQPALFTETTPRCASTARRSSARSPRVIRVKDYDEALAVANDTPFGLSAGIARPRSSMRRTSSATRQAGMVMVNLPTAGVDYHVPFGGRKGSSYGPREQGRYAAEFYTTVKTAYVNA
jgi:acyl-CoA reductase-like NAD-dependent aldehyde dehydrogenase